MMKRNTITAPWSVKKRLYVSASMMRLAAREELEPDEQREDAADEERDADHREVHERRCACGRASKSHDRIPCDASR